MKMVKEKKTWIVPFVETSDKEFYQHILTAATMEIDGFAYLTRNRLTYDPAEFQRCVTHAKLKFMEADRKKALIKRTDWGALYFTDPKFF